MRPRKPTVIARQHGGGLVFPLTILLVLSAALLSGCNTVSGMGEDLSAAGQGIDQTSENTQEKIDGKSSTKQQGSSDYQAGQY